MAWELARAGACEKLELVKQVCRAEQQRESQRGRLSLTLQHCEHQVEGSGMMSYAVHSGEQIKSL